MYIYIYIYIYIEIGKKQRDYTFIPISLFRDYSLIRGFFIKTGFIYASLVSTVY